jgi:transcription-repair coupling factor (superfamily II helicase)
MQALLTLLNELADFSAMRDNLKKNKAIFLNGPVDSEKLHLIYGLSEGYKVKIVLTYSEARVREIMEDARLYDRFAFTYPARDLIFYQADIHGNQLTKERIRACKRIMEGKPITLVTTFDALMSPQPPLSVLKDAMVSIKKDDDLELASLSEKLVRMGYEKVYQVDSPGQFSVRGGIVDIYDLTEENPVRMEFWGDTVDSIRSFDVLSQRSIEELQSFTVYPATEIILSKEELAAGLKKIEKEAVTQEEKLRADFKTEEAHRVKQQFKELKERLTEFNDFTNLESYVNYFYKDTASLADLIKDESHIFFLDEPGRIKEHAEATEAEFKESMSHRLEKGYILPGQLNILYSVNKTLAKLAGEPTVALSTLESKTRFISTDATFNIETRSIASFNNSFDSLVKDLKKYKKDSYRVLLLSGSRTRAKRLAEDLRDQEIPAVYSEDPARSVIPGEVLVCYGHVRRGFVYPLLKFVCISESDIFGAEKKKKKKKFSPYKGQGQAIADFAELRIGDYVIHETHGLGIYRGIEKIAVEGIAKDYMKIEYRDGGVLYIPATGLDLLQKYAASDSGKHKLNKLGSKEWVKTKTKVKGAVEEIAKDLVELYAKRQDRNGYVYGKDTVWQKEFEEMFPFEETEDQLAAIEATKADMESTKIMDRLICGDVGYGKTEIAIRAAFKAVQEGKQVVYLVPTTILAQQHYTTFTQRLKDFPVRVELLSRFRSSAQQKKTVEDLRKGMVDIVIGTHRVLSDDVQYKDLGLLIIDEEQRFGVTHKEKIKKLRENVDVLTLTATPIPRTLHMSLIGIRDMSILEEAPEDRLPIQTYVLEYNEEIVREAIVRELSRNGQVYYVYNQVNNIADIAAKIQELVPEANVAYAHGQMRENQLEKIMYDFVAGEIDVLVSTTIVETGLDISNVNTMIIHDSDRMGLSQLYQLRGRVGRSNRTAYAFLMYKRDKMITEVAEKRLEAIREFTDLGSGFKIAMRDLEIRGAGNLLGRTQHGHMEAVGYEMYCKMLNEAVKSLKGIDEIKDFPTVIDLDVDAFIPAEYIVNEVQKLDIYKRITGIETKAESEDMKGELLDRFGAVPTSVENLLRIALIRVAAHKLFFTEIKGKNEKITFTFYPGARINAAKIPEFLSNYKKKMSFTAVGVPYFTYKYEKTGIIDKDAENLLKDTEDILEKMQILLETAEG